MANKAVGFLTFNFGANLAGFNKAMKQAQRKVKRFGRSMKNVGSSMTTGLTMPIIGLGAIAIKTFANFEQAMLKVKAVSGATASEFKSLEANAKRLGSSTMFTASQVAELQLELSKLGLTPKEINKSTDSILSLAQATGHDLAQSATIVASTMNSFGMEAEDATKVADMFAVASSSAAIDMEKLSIAMPTVGATASAVGVPLEDLTSMMMTLADSGMQASKMGTHLRKIFVELALKGISYDEAMNQINTSTDKLKTATELFGGIAFSSGLTLAKNTEKTERYSKALDESAGKSQEMADIMDSGAAGAMRRLASQAEGVAITLGEMLIPVFEKLMGGIQESLAWWSGLDKSVKTNIVTIALFVAALGPALALIGSIATAFAMLLSPIGLVVAAIVAIVVAFAYVRENWDAFKERLGDWGWWKNALIQALQWVIEFSPISLLIKGFNELATYLGKDPIINPFETIADGLEDLKVETKEYENEFGSFVDAMKNQAKELGDALGILNNPLKLGGGSTQPTKKEDKKTSTLTSLNVDLGGPIAAIKSVSDEILNATDETTKSLGAKWSEYWDAWGTQITSSIQKARTLFSSLSELVGALNKKEMQEFENSRAIKNEALENDYEYELLTIQNSNMNEEQKLKYIEDLNTSYNKKKQESDEEFARQEKELKTKQAKREKAMGIMNAIISTAEGVMTVIGQFGLPLGLPLAIAVGAMGAVQIGLIASTPIPQFADGGIVSGPTVGLMGEYSGAGSGNPEVIAPLNKLKSMMAGGVQQIEVEGRLIGNDIWLSNSKTTGLRLRGV
tara:strand:- start:1203 stop:3590 length:2388 start_codon:yes stop_codon:yes gene_type:complete